VCDPLSLSSCATGFCGGQFCLPVLRSTAQQQGHPSLVEYEGSTNVETVSADADVSVNPAASWSYSSSVACHPRKEAFTYRSR
jgi:hypothetical protein